MKNLVHTLALSAPLLLAPTVAHAAMWVVYTHICTLAGECTKGTLPQKFVSKFECERAAQDFVYTMTSYKMVIIDVHCTRE